MPSRPNVRISCGWARRPNLRFRLAPGQEGRRMSEQEQNAQETAASPGADSAIEDAARAAEPAAAPRAQADGSSLGDHLSESDIETLLSAATFEDPVSGEALPADRSHAAPRGGRG